MLLTALVFLILIALAFWVVQVLPLPQIVKTILTVLLVVIVVLWIVQTFLGVDLGAMNL